MKKSKFVVTIMAIFFAASVLPSYAGDEETIVNTPTIVCNMCKKNISSALKKIEGVNKVNVDLKEKKVSVTFDDSKTNLEAIENAITSAGYDANDKKADHEAYEKLDGCCKIDGH